MAEELLRISAWSHFVQVPWTQDGLANAWRTPTLRRPAICEMLKGINKEFARDCENHPCNFLKKGW